MKDRPQKGGQPASVPEMSDRQRWLYDDIRASFKDLSEETVRKILNDPLLVPESGWKWLIQLRSDYGLETEFEK